MMCITIGGLPWQWPRTAKDGRGNCCGWTSAETAVAIAAYVRGSVVIVALPWQWPRMAVEIETAVSAAVAIAANFHGLLWLARRSLPRREPQHVPWPKPWHLPWKCHEPWQLPRKPADFHGSPW